VLRCALPQVQLNADFSRLRKCAECKLIPSFDSLLVSVGGAEKQHQLVVCCACIKGAREEANIAAMSIEQCAGLHDLNGHGIHQMKAAFGTPHDFMPHFGSPAPLEAKTKPSPVQKTIVKAKARPKAAPRPLPPQVWSACGTMLLSGHGSSHPKIGVALKNTVLQNTKLLQTWVSTGKVSIEHALVCTKGTLRSHWKVKKEPANGEHADQLVDFLEDLKANALAEGADASDNGAEESGEEGVDAWFDC